MSIFVALDTIDRESTHDPSYWRVYEIAEKSLMEKPDEFMEWISILHDDDNCYDLAYTFFRTIVNSTSHEKTLIREFIGTELKSAMFNDIKFPRHLVANRVGRMVSGSGCRGEDLRRGNVVLNENGFPTEEVVSGVLYELMKIRETGEYINPALALDMMDRMYWGLSEKTYGVLYLTAVLFYTRIVCNYRFRLPQNFYDNPPLLSELISRPGTLSNDVPDELCYIDGEFELERVCYREAEMLTSDYPVKHKASIYRGRSDKEIFPGMRDFHSHQEIVATPGALLCVSYGDQIHKIKLDYERMTKEQEIATSGLVVSFVKNLSDHLPKCLF